MRFFSLLISAVLLFTSCSNEEPVIADFEFVEKEKGLVLFTNKSSGAETYEQDFGNGQRSSEKNPSFQYDTNKQYVVNLTAKGAGGQNTKPKSIKISSIPAPVMISFDYVEKDNGFVTFTNKSI